jgi:hypothetical protein
VTATLRPPAEGSPRGGSRAAPRHAAPGARRGLVPYAAGLAAVAVLVLLHRSWAAQVLLVPLLLLLPGAILLRALHIPHRVISSFPAYVPCASIVVLFGSGLAVDVIGPLAGVHSPLRPVPLLAGFELTCLALLAVPRRSPLGPAANCPPPRRVAALAWPLLLPLSAAVGALRLNNAQGSAVAVITVVALVVMIVGTAALSARVSGRFLEMVLYAASLAMTWSSALRGDPLYGFDITTEYQRLQQTVSSGIWHTAHPGDAYGAMLSITVMPADLHALCGLPALVVFKVVYPMIFALFPVAIFGLARRVLTRGWAFVAAAFTLGQYAFSEIATLARQEVALVLFAALIAAMLESRLPRRPRWALAGLLGAALALSHYSTTYVAVTVAGGLVVLQWALSWFRRVPRVSGAVAVAFLVTLGSAAVWYGPVTHSESHLVQVVQTVEAQGLNILPNRTPGSSLISAYLQGNTRTPISADTYGRAISAYYARTKPYVTPLPAAAEPRYALRNATVPQPPVRWHLGYAALALSMLAVEQLANLLAAVGAAVMVLRRRGSVITRQLGLAALAMTLLLVVVRFSGTLALAYGQERAQLQGMVLLGAALCWALQAVGGLGRKRRALVRGLATGGLAVVFVNTLYLVGVMLGGPTSVNLSNTGPAFEYFYTTVPELASAQWLGHEAQPGELVYADEYGQVPLAAGARIPSGLMTDLTPQTLSQHAWVYASRANVVDGDAFALYSEHLATYAFPAAFLGANYDVVYTNGSSEVFHR